MKSAWRFFASVKLALVLLILLALSSIMGTLVPQGLPPEAYAARYGSLAGFFIGLRLTGLYHSVWFLALLLLLALNTVICTLSRLPAKWRRVFRPRVDADATGLLAMKVNGRLTRNAPVASVRIDVQAALAPRHYRATSVEKDNGLVILARKRRLGNFGPDMVHLGLLIVIIGGIVSSLAGSREQLALTEGQMLPVPRAAFTVRLDKFETEYYPQGNVKGWKSSVTIIAQNRPVAFGVIEVNRPFSFRGISFYQTSYGWDWEKAKLEITISKKNDPAFSRTVRAGLGERMPVSDNDVTAVSVENFVPDFVIGEGSEVQTRSLNPDNPAAQITGWKGGEKVFSGWIFAKFPDFTQIHSGKETDLSFALKSFEAPEFSVLEAAHDPGAGWIWAGCMLVTAGFFLAFYWPPHEIRFILEEVGGRTEITAGGHAAKSREAFRAEFDGLIKSLRRSQ